MIVIAVGGAVLAAIGELTSHALQRDKEAELLFVGQQYRQAIAAYYERSPGGAKRFPRTLAEMLEDNRYPVVQRYLRRPYPDPITGRPDWGLVEAPEGGIMGVYSLSETPPVKTGAFSKRDESFSDARRYADWKFFYAPATPATTAQQGGPAAAPSPNGPGVSHPGNTGK